jgi:hypothetical protein
MRALARALPLQAPLQALQQCIDREADDADRDHAGHHDVRADVGLSLHEQIADAPRGDDELRADERLPREAGDAEQEQLPFVMRSRIFTRSSTASRASRSSRAAAS